MSVHDVTSALSLVCVTYRELYALVLFRFVSCSVNMGGGGAFTCMRGQGS